VPTPDGVQWSASSDDETHGRKLYFLFAYKPETYPGYALAPGTAPQAEPPARPPAELWSGVQQALVKQSWAPVEAALLKPGEDQSRLVAHDGKQYTTGEQKELFVMYKAEPDAPGTDNGWVYATMSADGTKVLTAGRIESCMECHTKAKTDRQFGLPWTRRGGSPSVHGSEPRKK
jgi:hypothetical protein